MTTGDERGLGDGGSFQLWRETPSHLKLGYLDRYAAGELALDLGCGAGHYLRHLRSRGIKAFGLDLEPLFPGPGLAVGRVDALPFRDGAASIVLLFDVIEHTDDDGRVLDEVARVLDGVLILSVPNARDEPLVPYNLTFKHHKDKTHRREYDEAGLRRLLESKGFRVVCCRPEGPVHPGILAEFVRPAFLRPLARPAIRALFRLGFLGNDAIRCDLYAVATRGRGR